MYASFSYLVYSRNIIMLKCLVYRFDIADDETTVNISPDGHPEVPSMLVPSPPRQEDPPQQEEPYYATPSPVQEELHQG